MQHTLLRFGLTAAAGMTVLATVAAPAQGVPPSASATHYVSPTGANSKGDTSCSDAGYSSVQTAVDATPAGGTVVVCAGTYKESVSILSRLSLQGRPGAVIDATGGPYGVGIGADYVTVTGLTVKNATADANTQAPGDGIVTAAFGQSGPVVGDHAVITQNRTVHNDGAGIDLNSTSSSEAADNVSRHNGIGVNLSNDLGAASSHNLVSGNDASKNPGGCGIVLADHTGSGVFRNVISGNTADDNGLGTPSAPNASSGSGIIIAAGGPTGGVYNNVLRSNRLSGNGHAGVALHAHTKGPNFSGNRILDNTIGTNNRRTDFKDRKTTGIYLGDAAKLSIVVSNNLIHDDKIGVFTAGRITVHGKSSNAFRHVAAHFVHIAAYAG